MTGGERVRRRVVAAIFAAMTPAVAVLPAARAQTSAPAPRGTTQIRVLGLAVDLDARPDVPGLQTSMTAVKDVPAGVETFVGSLADPATRAQLAGVRVAAELSGPSLGALHLEVSAPANAAMELPLLRAAGRHVLSNVRLEDASGAVLLARDPTLPPIEIEVIDELLVTSVTSRPLTLAEIEEKGIVIDATNFQVKSFVVGLTLGSRQVSIELPVAIPATTQALATLEVPDLTRLPAFEDELRKVDIPNLSLSGFSLRVPPEVEEEERRLVPPIEGVVVIPGNVAFLNQFFSVVVQATNQAPAGSGLTVRAARSTLSLPAGGDAIAGTGDDPLRMAVLASGPQATAQPLVDDAGVDAIEPQSTSHAEHLVEGRREGTHVLDFDLRGDLFVPALGRSVELRGVAKGVVQVKNPSFSVVLAHPRVVRDGEGYSLFATVTNTSQAPANLFQIDLAARSLSGTSLAPGETTKRQLDALVPGDSATFEWRLVSRSTGEVTGTVFLAQEGVNGSFVLAHGVGDTGVPLSPDTLVLPQITRAIPDDPPLVAAAVRMLGQAYSVATAPGGALPANVARIGKSFVSERAVRVAQAGLHVRLGEPLAASTQELLLDWLGNDRARLATLIADAGARRSTESSLDAFDALRRASAAGAHFTRVAGDVLAGGLAGRPATELPAELGARFATRPGMLAIAAAGRGGALELELRDAGGARLGRLDPAATPANEIPFAAQIPLARSATASDDLVLVASPENEAYTFALTAPAGASAVDLSALFVAASGPVVVTWPRLDLAAGGSARLRIEPGAGTPLVLDVDDDADGVADRSLAAARVDPVIDAPPALVAAHQWAKGDRPDVAPRFESGDPLGRLVAVLFDEEVDPSTAQSATSWALASNRVLSAALQADRRTVFLVSEAPVGPFVAREITARGITDRAGHARAASSRTVEGDPERGLAGRVTGSVVTVDGRPIPFARVKYVQPMFQTSLFECFPQDFVVSAVEADAAGRFDLDFVLASGFSREEICSADRWLNVRDAGPTDHFKLEAEDPQTGDLAKLSTRIQFDAQHMSVQLVSRGLAELEGSVTDEAGAPIAGGDPGTAASLQVQAINLSTGELAASWVDASGHYAFPRSFRAPDGAGTEAPRLAVGNVALLVVRPSDGLTGVATTNLPAAGAHVVQDVVMSAPFRFGSVSGVVFEADGRSPARNVVVDLAGQVLTGASLSGRTSKSARIASTVSDAAGRFAFSNVPAGDIEVAATRQATFEQVRTRAAVSGGLDTPLQLVLPGAGGTVRGLVRDALGNVVASALVAGGPTLTTTDANGRFELRGLPRGTFTVSSRTVDSPALGTISVTTTRADDVQDVVLVLEPVGTIGGSIVEADGTTPVAGQKVQLWLDESAVAAETFTASDGSYLVAGLPLGRYSVRAIRASDLDGGMALTEIRFAGDVRDADVAFRGLGEVEGRVLQDNGTPAIADVLVQHKRWKIVPDTGPVDNAALGLAMLEQYAQIPELADLVGRTIVENGLDQRPNGFFVLSDDVIATRSAQLGPGGEVTGRFHVSGAITGGPFTVAAFGPFLAPAEVTSEIPRTTDPAARRVDVGDLVLAPTTGAVRGTVFIPDGTTPVGANVRVKVRSLGSSGEVKTVVGVQSQPVLPEIDAVTDANGRFELPLVLRGPVVLTADTGAPDPQIAARDASEIRTDRFDDPSGSRALNVRLFGRTIGVVPQLPPGDFVTLDVRLEDAAGARVRVVESDGTTPVAGARVQVATGSALDTDPAAAFTDTNGEVDFFPLPEGTFSASVTVPGRPHRGGATGIVPVDVPNGTELPVLVMLGAVTTASGQILAAPIFGSVEGVVRRADGTPSASPCEVTLTSSGVSIVTTSGADGRYRADGVPGGALGVRVLEPFTARRGTASGSITSDAQIVTVDVTLIGLGSVSGMVTTSDGARTVPNADVVLHPSSDFSDRLVTRTDARGLFSLPGVPLGVHRVVARDFQTGLSGEASGVLARDGESTTTDVALQASGGITGVLYQPGVLLDASGQPVHPDGSPRPDAPVAAGVEVTIAGPRRQTVQTRADGSFASAGFLPLGDYSLTARSTARDDGATGRASIRFDAELAFSALVLRGAGRVEGVVLDSLGAAPVASASVTLASESPFARGATTRISDAAGRFAFDDVPLGAFSLSVRENLQIPALGGAAQGEIRAHGDVIAFEDGDADPVRDAIRLQAAADVAGRLVLADAASAAAGAVVLLAGNGLGITRIADTTGAFRFDGIPLGRWALSVRETSRNGVAAVPIELRSNGEQMDLGTIVLDEVSPVLVSSQPAASTSNVAPSAALELHFSEPIDPASVTPATLPVTIAGAAVPGSLAVTGATIVFSPSAPLPDLARIDVRARADVRDFEGRTSFAGVRDRAGRSLDADVSFFFTTADTTPPSVVSISPAPGATEIDPRAVVRIELSEAIDRAALGGMSLRDGAGASVPGSIETLSRFGDRVLVFTPATPLAPNQAFTWRLDGPIRDVAGNAIPAGFLTGSFRSVDTLAPVLAFLGFSPGARLVSGRSVVATADLAQPDATASVEFQLNGSLLGTATAAPFALSLVLAPALGAQATLGAVAIDAAGNRSAPMQRTFAIGANAPPSVRLASIPGAPVAQGAAVTIDVAADDDVGLSSLRFDVDDGAIASGAQPVNGESASARFTFVVPPGSRAGSTLRVRASAVDVLGLVSEAPLAVLDVADRLAPTLSFASPAAGSTIEPGASASLVVRADDASGIAELRLSAAALAFDDVRTITPPVGPATLRFDVAVPVDAAPGPLRFTARARDASGNAASRDLVLSVADRRAPVASLALAGGGASVEPGTLASLDVSAVDETGVARLELVVDGVTHTRSVTPAQPSASARFDVPVPARLVPGDAFTVSALARDAAGNASAPVSLQLAVVDRSAPAVSLLAPADGAQIAPGGVIAIQAEASDPFGVARIAFAAQGAAAGSGDERFAPPRPSATSAFSLAVPATATAGAAIEIDVVAEDAAGNVSAPRRATLRIADVVAPSVLRVDPADGASDVALDAGVHVTFDEPLDPASVNELGVSLASASGAPVPASLVLSPERREIALTPVAPLLPDTAYVLAVDGVMDASGNALPVPFTSRFTTRPPDRRGPRLVSLEPLDAATGVSVRPPVRACFDDALDPASLAPNANGVAPLRLRAIATDALVAGALSLDVARRCVQLAPAAALAFDAEHRVELDGALLGADGNPIAGADGLPFATLAQQFRTTSFGLIAPAEGSVLVEHEPYALEASGSPALGIASIVFETNGVALPALTSAPFRTTQLAPPALSAALHVRAIARDASGAELARDERLVPVVIGVRFERSVLAAPLGAMASLRLVATSAQASDLVVPLAVHDPAILGAPSVAVIPAGATATGVALSGLAEGATALVASTPAGDVSAIVAVSPEVPPVLFPHGTAPQSTLPLVVAAPVGATVASRELAGEVVLQPRASARVRVAVRPGPAGAAETFTLRSLDPSIVAVPSSATAQAGDTTLEIDLTAGLAGETRIDVVGADGRSGREVRVLVGTAVPATTAAILAPPVGAAVVAPPSLGNVVVPLASTRDVRLRLLDLPVASDVVFVARSSDPAVARALSAAVVPALSKEAPVTIESGAAGSATIAFVGPDGRSHRELRVVVGTLLPDETPSVLAAPIGVGVLPAASLGTVVLPIGASRSVRVRVLDVPASSDTPLDVRSDDPAVALPLSPVVVPAFATDAAITITSIAPGTATLTLYAASGRGLRSLGVVAGAASPGELPPVLAPPLGAAVLEPGTLATVLLQPGGSRSVRLELQSFGSLADLPVTVESRDTAIATASPRVQTLAIGARTIDLQIDAAASADGETIVDVRFGLEHRTIRVLVGAAARAAAPPAVAPPIGVEVNDAGSP